MTAGVLRGSAGGTAAVSPVLLWLLVAGLSLVPVGARAEVESPERQLDMVRERIRTLDSNLKQLDREADSARSERDRLDLQLGLAEAEVEELELVVERSKAEVAALRDRVEALARELEARRRLMERHLEMTALLGKPGPLQLLHDALHGGDLERAVSTAVVLTEGQAKLLTEYRKVRTERSLQLAELSRAFERTRREMEELDSRRQRLVEVRNQVQQRLAALERRRQETGSELEDLKQREAALTRLMARLADRTPFAGREDIRAFRGALPWPVEGRIVQTFGRHFLPKYSTYTVCNGLWLDVPLGREVQAVFRGEVAFARHFKGYGNMVVVDHGRGVYSLVAGLSTIHVRIGQLVDLGTRLGLAGPHKDGGNLYLEFRIGGRPSDPRRWLQLREGDA